MKRIIYIITIALSAYSTAQVQVLVHQDCSKNGVQVDLYGTNGHDYVDLGLSVYWATCNVGATTPEGYGDYFAWGETSPKYTYTWANYKYCNGTSSVMTKYNSTDGKTVLDLGDDAAHVNWGGAWRMPTNEELNELFYSCSKSNKSINSTDGYLFTANGKSVFIPKAGSSYDGTTNNINSHVDLWTSSLCSNISKAVLYGGDGKNRGKYEGARYEGRSIRAVCPKTFTPTGEEATLTLLASGCSTTNTYTCNKGQQVNIKADPQENYEFIQWSDGNTDNPRTITVKSNIAYMATFAPKQYTISTPTTVGQVTGGGTYTYGTQVQLTAIAYAHSTFVRWSDGVTDNPRTITVTGDTTYSPIFAVDQHNVTISVQNGTVSGAGKYNYGTQIFISATANYGYHFSQWSDGNTDNPRSITVLSDTAFTALCEVNSYTISATAANGTFIGTGQYIYMSTCSLTAVPDDHYHFVQWSDGVKTNPRTITVMGDASYLAIFAIDQHTITVTTTNGTATGSGTYNYGTNLTLTVTPPFCYQFISWSDGNTYNPRSIVVEADATYNAFCEKIQVASGTCGDNLTWTLDINTGVLTISGTGAMTDYTSASQTPWYPYLSYTNFSKVIFNEGITHIGNYVFYGYSALKEVRLPHTVQTIGKYAFAECRELEKVTLGEGLRSIGDYAFSNCIRIEEITCLANRTPDVAEHTFNNVSHYAYVYVRSEYLHKYQVNMYWTVFDLKTIGAQSVSTDGQVSVEPNIDNAVFTWPTDAQAASYSLEITKEGAVFCTLTFNSLGQLTGLAFAPGRGTAMEATEQAAIQSGNGFTFTVTGLNSASAYAFNMDVKDSGNQTIKSYTGTFQTKGGVVTNLDNQLTNSPVNQFNKIIKDNQLIILREGKTYNAQGTEVR